MKFQKDGKVMEVCNELQASVFIRNGYTEVKEGPKTVRAEEPKEELVKEKPAPKKRSRKKAEVTVDDDDKKFTGLIDE